MMFQPYNILIYFVKKKILSGNITFFVSGKRNGVRFKLQEIKIFCMDAWEGDYCLAARQALEEIIEYRMPNLVDAYLGQLLAQEISDRCKTKEMKNLIL